MNIMTDIDLLNNAIDILLHNGISSVDLQYIRKYKNEFLQDDISDEDRHLLGAIEPGENGINYILLYSRTDQDYWNIRALWINPELRRKKIATALLSQIRLHSRNSKGVTIFVPFNEQRFTLSKVLLRNGYSFNRYIASISASEYNSIW